MLSELPILIGAAISLATLLLCRIAGTGLSAAVIAAVWTSAGIVLSIEPDHAAASGVGSCSSEHSSARSWVRGSSSSGACRSPSAGAGARQRLRLPRLDADLVTAAHDTAARRGP